MAAIDAKVARLLDQSLVAFNVGSDVGVKVGDKAVLWRTADLSDPDTNEPLGELRMEALMLSIVHVQERLCVGRITSPVESQGLFSGVVIGGWEQRKRATSDSASSDGKNLVLVLVGDQATIYTTPSMKEITN